MIYQGVEFFIPTYDNEIVRVRNFDRTDSQLSENRISLTDLNQSDYLYQVIILCILRKLDINRNLNNIDDYYNLINKIERFQNDVYQFETRSVGDIDDFSNGRFLEVSREISRMCIELGILLNE